MKLSEVFLSLLSAEDHAVENISTAKNEAARLRRRAHESFEENRKTALDVAHANARAVVEAARQRGDREALDILNTGESARKKISELFERDVNEIMSALAREVADECRKKLSAI